MYNNLRNMKCDLANRIVCMSVLTPPQWVKQLYHITFPMCQILWIVNQLVLYISPIHLRYSTMIWYYMYRHLCLSLYITMLGLLTVYIWTDNKYTFKNDVDFPIVQWLQVNNQIVIALVLLHLNYHFQLTLNNQSCKHLYLSFFTQSVESYTKS